VASDQIRHRLKNVGRRVTWILNQQAGALNDRLAGPVWQREQGKARHLFQPPGTSQAAKALRSDQRFDRPIYRHNTSVIGSNMTPEFRIESCFIYTIV
jgi:hypothetical protein